MTPTPEDPTPLDRFTSDATKRAALYALLRDPVLTEAMEVAEDEMRPKTGTPADTNQALTIAKFHQSAGVSQFIIALHRMTREPKAPVRPTVRRMATSIDDLPKSDNQ